MIRRIFRMAADAVPITKIAETLTAERVMNPAAHQEIAYGTESRNHRYQDPCLWNNGTIIRILERQEYLGHTVLGKTVQENFKSKKRKWLSPEDWLIFPNTHEAIIDQETWDMAADFQSKCNACEQKTSCGHFQPRRLRGLRLSIA
ncbi:recombinase family protein [Atopobiaceae bacterium HCP3S3_D6]